MKVILHNPKMATVSILYDFDFMGFTNEQAINRIESTLKQHSIICDKITVEREKKK